MPSMVTMSPTMPVRNVPPVLMGAGPAGAGVVAPAEAAGGGVPRMTVGAGVAAAEMVGFGGVGAAAGAQAANSAVTLMPRMRSMAARRLMPNPGSCADCGLRAVVMRSPPLHGA